MSFRAFISIDIDAGQSLRELCRELKQSGAALKVVNPDIMHITLKFLGDVEEPLVEDISRVIRDSVHDVSRFEMKLHDIGAFPNKNRIRVVWVGIPDPGPLERVAERLDEGLSPLGFEMEKRKFRPHLTVARAKTPQGMDRVQEIMERWGNTDFGSQVVDRIRLKKSVLGPKGPTYFTVEEVGLL
ncbi:MAG: RNA 2',3'-cyclic phosphodiesterase [Methanomassiliicoccales archaeon]|nr:RNA 2',3'-cyclic phosphodiesterase [Methanomassiliicoccales archaeon]